MSKFRTRKTHRPKQVNSRKLKSSVTRNSVIEVTRKGKARLPKDIQARNDRYKTKILTEREYSDHKVIGNSADNARRKNAKMRMDDKEIKPKTFGSMQNLYGIGTDRVSDNQGRSMQNLYGVGTPEITKKPTFVAQNKSVWAKSTRSQSFKQSLITKCINRGADTGLVRKIENMDADKLMELFDKGIFGDVEEYFDYGDEYDDSQGFVSKVGNTDAAEIINTYKAYYGSY